MAKTDGFCNRAEAYEAHDNVPLSPARGDTIGDLILRALRPPRDDARNARVVAIASLCSGRRFSPRQSEHRSVARPLRLRRRSRPASTSTHHVADGYEARLLIRWGDPLFPDLPRLRSAAANRRRAAQAVRLQQRLHRLLPARRERQPRAAVRQPRIHQRRGDVPRPRPPGPIGFPDMTAELVEIEMAAHGVTIVEIARGRRAVGDRCSTAHTTAASARPTRR